MIPFEPGSGKLPGFFYIHLKISSKDSFEKHQPAVEDFLVKSQLIV